LPRKTFQKIKFGFGAAVSAALVACGGGGDSGPTTTAPSSTITIPTPTPPTNPVVIVATQTVIDYINVRHTQVSTDFTTSEKSLSASLAAQGSLISGAHYTKSAANYATVIDGFLADVLKFIQAKVQTSVVDKSTITALLRNYQSSDANFPYSYYGTDWGLTGSALQTFTAGVANSVNTSYNLTVLQLP
jgi:ABC-type glycerol-3-phosphate transport system substrate-binding protein